MTYRFKLHEPIAKGVSRIGLEQIETAELQVTAADGDGAVHNIRRCLKRLRAILRLVRPALPEAVYRRETRAIASIGRQFASARDRVVMRQTLMKLEARFGALPTGLGPRLEKLLAKPAARQPSRIATKDRRAAVAALAKTKQFFARIERAGIRLEHASEGLERTYRRARRLFGDGYQHPSDGALHEWRKSVQQHWRHMQLLSRAWPDVLGGRAREAKELSRLLGEDHDLALLAAFVAEHPDAETPSGDREELIRRCRSWQLELRELAKPRGRRLFAEPAADFASRLMTYWSEAESLSRLEPAREKAEKNPPVKARGGRRGRAGSRQAASRGLRKGTSSSRGR
jgi:CHAD domain-containing protein